MRTNLFLSHRAVLCLIAAVALVSVIPYTGQVAAQQAPGILLDAPAAVSAGMPIELVLRLSGGTTIAAYEASLLFDTSVAHLSELRQIDSEFGQSAGGIGVLSAVDIPNGIAMGAYGCSLAQCHDAPSPPVPLLLSGTRQLATIVLGARQPGRLELRLDQVKVVTAAGDIVPIAGVPPIVVQVGPAVNQTLFTAPAGAPPATAGAGTAAAAGQGSLDLTQDGQVTYADVAEVSLAWTDARRMGACALPGPSAADVNSDGCVDIADVQRVVGAAGVDTRLGPGLLASHTFTVNSTLDTADSSIGNGVCQTSSGVCTLRAAIAESSALAGSDTIQFNIPGQGVAIIQVGSSLPSISDTTGPTIIDGYTQPDAKANTDSRVSNAVIRVQLEGGGEAAYDALRMTSANNQVKGLAISKFHSPIVLYGPGSQENSVTGNFIGTNAAGTYYATATSPGGSGVRVQEGADKNRIGGTTAAERNVISGNGHNGVAIYNEATDYNVIYGNLIGLNPAGTASTPNRNHGVDINTGASYTVVGGTGAGEGNVVSGNGYEGIEVSHGENTSYNSIIGNKIGTDPTGNQVFPYTANVHFGVRLEDGAFATTVRDNVIGNNKGGGISIDGYYSGFYSAQNVISNNRIGISLNNSAIPNEMFGIQLDNHAYQTRIGPGNIITNHFVGIRIIDVDSDRNTFTQNSIYGNQWYGIDIEPLGQINPNDPGDGDTGGNQQLNYPVLTSATPSQVTGTACAGCVVEIFRADRWAGYGQGRTYLGSVTAGNNGAFTASISGLVAGNSITSTATDPDGNTSEFSLNFTVTSSPATATPTPTSSPATATPTPTSKTPTTSPTPTSKTATPTTTPVPSPPPGQWRDYLPFIAR